MKTCGGGRGFFFWGEGDVRLVIERLRVRCCRRGINRYSSSDTRRARWRSGETGGASPPPGGELESRRTYRCFMDVFENEVSPIGMLPTKFGGRALLQRGAVLVRLHRAGF